ncbi:unnamed protein product [Prorocentrum cordatum]|uniref:HEAT repeat-containing protein 1 n=1 Tax=Prorocentrum cordatum TaxID=2364126 RepID=A0ABN9Y7R0_9DINO|nr:unnamed protein product [Polarella glacialis]
MWHVRLGRPRRPEPRRRVAPGSRRGFGRRRKVRLDEYNQYEAPVKLRMWRNMNKEGGFFPHQFENMTAHETADTVFAAVKLKVHGPDFWGRAALAVGDAAGSLSSKQLATVCWSFGAAKWSDERLMAALAPYLIRSAGSMRPGHVAVVAQAFARTKVHHAAVLRALSESAEANPRLTGKGYTMLSDSFAALRFRSDGFHKRLDAWAAAGGVNSCTGEEAVALTHSMSLLLQPGPPDAPGGQLLRALADHLAQSLETGALEPPVILTGLLAIGRLGAADARVLASLEMAVGHEMHRLSALSLPAILDAFTRLYTSGGAAEGALPLSEERRRLLGTLTGALTRQLRQVRPQDATRALQALERLGLMDPHLLAGAQELVPSRLAAWPPASVLALLESYAAASNRDGLMLPCLRRALLPPVGSGGGGSGSEGFLDPAPLAQLDDHAVARAAEAFASLGHREGVAGILVCVGARRRRLQGSCELALAATMQVLCPAAGDWEAAAEALAASEPQAAGGIRAALGPEAREEWRSRADLPVASADAVLLALLAFPRHSCGQAWAEGLAARAAECDAALLPALLLQGGAGHAALCAAAEAALLEHLAAGCAASFQAPAAAAACRALAERAKGRSAPEREPLREGACRLSRRAAELSGGGALPPKGLVRVLQALEVFQVSPPRRLVQQLAEEGAALTPQEFLLALRALPRRSLGEAPDCARSIAGMATRVMRTPAAGMPGSAARACVVSTASGSWPPP